MSRMTIAEFQAMADRASPFFDAAWNGDGWKPSELLRVGYFTLLTGPHPESAEDFARTMLAAARDLYRRGLPANPFAALTQKEPQHG